LESKEKKRQTKVVATKKIKIKIEIKKNKRQKKVVGIKREKTTEKSCCH